MSQAGSVNVPGAQSAMNFAQPTIGGIQSNIQGGVQAYPSAAMSAIPMAQQTLGNLYSNPYAGTYQAAARPASQLGESAAVNAYNIGGQLIPGASQILQTGFDPEQALQTRMQQAIVDQTNAALSGQGLAGAGTTSPYAGGVVGQTVSNFQQDWYNQRLARQAHRPAPVREHRARRRGGRRERAWRHIRCHSQ